MTDEKLYAVIAALMETNGSANSGQIVKHTPEDARRVVLATYGNDPSRKQIENVLINLVWHARNAVWLAVGGTDGLLDALNTPTDGLGRSVRE